MLGDNRRASQVVVRHKWDKCNTQNNTSVWEAKDGIAAAHRTINGYGYPMDKNHIRL
jgi:hypothetical protein